MKADTLDFILLKESNQMTVLSSSGDINHPKLPPSHISGIDLRSGSNRLLESVPELVDSNYLLEKSGENRNVSIKQKSLLEFIG